MAETRWILRTVNKEFNAAEIKTTLHQLQSLITNQQGRPALVSRQHVSEDQADSIPRSLWKDRHALIAQDSVKALRRLRWSHLLRARDKLDCGQYHCAHERRGGEFYRAEGIDELWQVEEFLPQRFCHAQKRGFGIFPQPPQKPHLRSLRTLRTFLFI